MSSTAAIDPSLPATPGLSQVERVADTFVAPSKTFIDIRRNTSWWLPFLLMLVFSVASAVVVGHDVGYDRVYQNSLNASPSQKDRIDQLEPAQKERAISIGVVSMKVSGYGLPAILLIILSIYALILWASFNFGLGAQTTYGQVLAVTWYAALPYLITSVAGMLFVHFGGNAEAYDIKNPVGTNLGYYMPDAAPWLRALLTQFDVVKIWSDILQVIGMSIIARKSIAQSAIIVGMIWLLGVLFTVGLAAMFG